MFSSQIGEVESLVVCQVYYWLELFSKQPEKYAKNQYENGQWWVRNPIETTEPDENDWASQFPQIKTDRLKDYFKKLVNDGILLRENRNPKKYDRTWSYSIDFEVLYSRFPGCEYFLPPLPLGENPTMDYGENPTMDSGEIHRPIQKNNIKNTNKNNSSMEFSEENSTRLNFDIVKRQIRKVCKDKELSQEDADTITEVFRYFYEQFERYTGREHTRLSNKNISSVIDNLRYSEDEDSHTEFEISIAGIDTVKRMIDNYFSEQHGLKVDSILHFTSAGILIHRYLEVMRDNDGLPFDY